MAGPIQSAAGRATVATGALASKIGNTVFQITGDAMGSNDSSVSTNGGENTQSNVNVDIERQAEANRISIEHVKAKQHQTSEFAKRLGATGTAGGGE